MRKHPLVCVTIALSISMTVACRTSRSEERRLDHAISLSGAGAMEIARTELNSVRGQATNAYDLIRRLRPAMLTSRDPSVSSSRTQHLSPDAPGVSLYVDGMHVGGLDVLSSIPARSITSIRRISASTASAQFGAGLSAGAIVITTEASSSRSK
jgi:hypothetical protein